MTSKISAQATVVVGDGFSPSAVLRHVAASQGRSAVTGSGPNSRPQSAIVSSGSAGISPAVGAYVARTAAPGGRPARVTMGAGSIPAVGAHIAKAARKAG